MRKLDSRSLAVDLLKRSRCSVQVAAVIFDSYGIFAWGWNSCGPTGFGQHAEQHAISRANSKRLVGASIAVAGTRRGRIVPSIPCDTCQRRLLKSGILVVYFQNKSGSWERLVL